MIYKVKQKGKATQTYEGIKHHDITNPAPSYLGIIWWDGECDYWELDGNNLQVACAELKRLYRSEHEVDIHIHIFKYDGGV